MVHCTLKCCLDPCVPNTLARFFPLLASFFSSTPTTIQSRGGRNALGRHRSA